MKEIIYLHMIDKNYLIVNIEEGNKII